MPARADAPNAARSRCGTPADESAIDPVARTRAGVAGGRPPTPVSCNQSIRTRVEIGNPRLGRGSFSPSDRPSSGPGPVIPTGRTNSHPASISARTEPDILQAAGRQRSSSSPEYGISLTERREIRRQIERPAVVNPPPRNVVATTGQNQGHGAQKRRRERVIASAKPPPLRREPQCRESAPTIPPPIGNPQRQECRPAEIRTPRRHKPIRRRACSPP